MSLKKIIFPLFVLIFIGLFSACKKCKDCTCQQTISQTGMPDVNQTVQLEKVCGEDLEETEGTTTVTQNVGGINQTVTQSCECN
tara:strand:- start:285 stop:536 length:252 start_codon:yes stop_codon:yes gene_type:complete